VNLTSDWEGARLINEHDQCVVLWNRNQMFECIIRLLENAKTEVRAFLSSYTLVITADNELIKAPRLAARARGVKLRYITEITNENIPYCNR
jgi:hypothetical protein